MVFYIKMKLDSLINQGLWFVYGPAILFVVASGLTANYFIPYVLAAEIVDFTVVVIVFFSICIAWLWWSYRIVKWKIFACSQIAIEDRYQLYEKAIEVGLIWPSTSMFTKTELWTKKDKENWKKKVRPEIRALFDNK